ncbi:MAG: bifunctional demethylmenaquinone methyltransferase/2-methoxy-6-polyprenyl-1,4-benzoquinol methylase UbiE [Myxococcales bacterium]|nr:bifunctional demethylmenaquinone methyltransferase/2-methoxy-6-polyprenyl-1,4-benzoquinol methylase UbiE [Myxococcales bacterium]
MTLEITPEQGGQRLGSGAMFDRIADRYDLLNRIISLGIDGSWRRKTVRALGLGDDAHVLDVATGTADLALEIAGHAPSAHIVGLDPSEGMLAVGRKKVDRAGLTDRVSLVVGDAMSLPFEDATFDAITIAFGIRNVPDRPKGLEEMLRVTKPGGTLAILELSEPEGGVMGSLAKMHVHTIVPFVGGLLSGSQEYRYLQRSIAAFPPADQFGQIMHKAGWEVERIEPLTFGVAHLYVGRKPA